MSQALESEQPYFVGGDLTESAANTFTSDEIALPMDIEGQLFFDIEEVRMKCSSPAKAPGANTLATFKVQLLVSDDTPTDFLAYDDPKMVAEYSVTALYNATDKIVVYESTFSPAIWRFDGMENIIPDDRVWLCIKGTSNTAAGFCYVRIKGRLTKVTDADFKGIIFSRL